MRWTIPLLLLLLTATHARAKETPTVVDGNLEFLLDIDQPREQKPGGAWTEQRYIGPKRYDAPWKDIEAQGYIAPADCVEVRVTLTDHERLVYASAEPEDKYKLASTTATNTLQWGRLTCGNCLCFQFIPNQSLNEILPGETSSM